MHTHFTLVTSRSEVRPSQCYNTGFIQLARIQSLTELTERSADLSCGISATAKVPEVKF
jgi:hypothetical protein